MKKALTLLACAGLLAACDNKESTNVLPSNPTPQAVTGAFTIDFDSFAFRIDSVRGYFLNAAGFLDSGITVGKYHWESPARRYDRLDTGYAAVKAFGIRRLPNAAIPEMKFSENFTPAHLNTKQGVGATDSGMYFMSVRGFRY